MKTTKKNVVESWEDIEVDAEDAEQPVDSGPRLPLPKAPFSGPGLINMEFAGISTYKPTIKIQARPSNANASPTASTKPQPKIETPLTMAERERLYQLSKERIFGTKGKPDANS